MALIALMEPCSISWRIRHFPLDTYLHHFAPGICTITTTLVLNSSQGLQLWCSHLHNQRQCLCLSSADSRIIPLSYCSISDAALASYMLTIEILSQIAIQTWLQINRLLLHLLLHYCILQV